MFIIKWLLSTAAVSTALAVGQAADDVYDLRGPAPEKGQVYLSKSTMTIKDADTTARKKQRFSL
jgi:hypothetical protein